jgi:hypothetical protein
LRILTPEMPAILYFGAKTLKRKAIGISVVLEVSTAGRQVIRQLRQPKPLVNPFLQTK